MTPFIHDILAKEGWGGLFLFAKKQSLVGVVWDEVRGCLEEYGGIPPQVLKQWVTLVGKIEEKNKLVDEVAWRISARFAEDGFHSLILKGQGVSLYYPKPHLRQSGDIDIWLWTEDTKGNLCKRRKIIIDYTRRIKPKARACYHHIEFKKIHGTEVEAHFTPSWMYSPKKNKYLQGYFNGYLQTLQDKPQEPGRFNSPSDEFNLVFILVHIYRHLFDEGIGLRQMMDYDMIVRKASAEDKSNALKHIDALGLHMFTGAVMYILRMVFGTYEDMLLCETNRKEGEWLLTLVMDGGNFGLHKPGTHASPKGETSHIHNLATRSVRSAKLLTHYTEESLWAIPWRLWHWWWRLDKKYI